MSGVALPNTEILLSPLGLGTAAMGRDPRAWGPADDNESVSAIRTALEAGVNWIETSPDYGDGHAEQVVGAAIADCRDSVNIVGGYGRAPAAAPDEPIGVALRRSCEASLRRLRTDHIELFVIRIAALPEPIEDAAAAIEALRQQGKVGAIGLSGAVCDQIARWRATAPLHAVRGRLNLFETEALEDLAPYCAGVGLAFLACSPLCRGLLAGAHQPTARFTDLRSRDPQFLGRRFQTNLESVAELCQLPASRERGPAQLAVAWVLSQSPVSAAVVGVRRPSQVRGWAGALEWRLEAAERRAVEGVLARRAEQIAASA